MSALYVSCKIGRDGRITGVRRSSSTSEQPGFIPVTDRELAAQIVDRPRAFRYADGKWTGSRMVTLTRQKKWFYADDAEIMSLGVQGVSKRDETVHVVLNDVHINLRWNDTVDFTAAEPGVWSFRLDDVRFWARPDAITVTAVNRGEEDATA